jgi:hypothetical protein
MCRHQRSGKQETIAMPTIHPLTVVLFTLLALLAVVQGVRFIMRRRSRRRNRTSQESPVYAVGSLEDNARIVNMIYTLNERLADLGKRIPERAAMDVIQRSTGEEGGPGE